ncbi:hypothetical protein QM285_22540, partial [Stutzerimonas stutzeri]|nr:hypothetical protein [Stutzerimonas stutzeri]
YKAPGREEFLYETTIAAEREHNVHIHSGISEEQFAAAHVDLHRRQDQGRHAQRGIACGAHGDELLLAD